MRFLRLASNALALAVILVNAAIAADRYPNRPVRFVTSGIGGSADFVARLLAQGLATPFGQQVIVDNRGNGVVPGMIVSKAQPDGYTLLVAGATLWNGPLFGEAAAYDPIADFLPITLATKSPNVLVVNPQVPAKSVKELIALAKAKPGVLNYGSGATGASSHLAAELFKSMAGVNIIRVPYKSNAVQIADLIGGQVQMMFSNATAPPPHIKSGKLRGLAVTTAKRSVLYPDLPTIAESVPGYEYVQVNGAFAPPRTPPKLLDFLNREMVRVLTDQELREKFLGAALEPEGSSPKAFGDWLRAEIALSKKLIKTQGLHD